METKRIIQVISLAILLLLPASIAYGQITFGQPTSGSTGLVYTSWTLTPQRVDSITPEIKISQFWIPIEGYVPLKDNLEARIFLANGSTNLEAIDSDVDVSGLSDVSVQFSQSLSDDQWLISAGFNLPTGKKKLNSSTERAVLQTLAQSFLDFPMRSYGEGFGFNLLVGTARQVGEFMFSGGAMYQYVGAYEPYLGVDDYDPGDKININASVETKRGSLTWTANVIYAGYQADQNAGYKVFKQGNHLNLGLGLRTSNDKTTFGGQVRYMIRARNSRYGGADEAVIERLKLYGNEFEMSFDAVLSLNSSWKLRPLASYRIIEENEIEVGSSNILTVGATGATNLSQDLGLEVGVKYLTGQAIDNLYDLSGLQITAGLSASF